MNDEERFEIQKRIELFLRLGHFRRAYKLAEEIEMKLIVISSNGTEYNIRKDGSMKRVIPKRKHK